MSSGPQHYREAEQLLGYACELGDEMRGSTRDMSFLAEAQVHATLALTAAKALSEGGMMPGAEFDAWGAVCVSQPSTTPIPAVDASQVWWLDDGQENPGEPPLFTTEKAARTAAVERYCQDNPHHDPDSDQVDWLVPEDEDDATGEVELAVRGRRTGIFVRPIRPDGA